ncbi:MAG: metallophosphoesterase [Candidatus Thermoplasmatota archaeon]|nr:metallophosphoesterase [Candidatus Thermoplasmatota archaeon]MBS3790259.1 metallophosphoesterase [Candidatus Thermoplasmatota archaeon]
MNRIEIRDGLFLTSDYCVWYEKKGTVIFTDFHLGYKSALKEDGISLPTFQKEKLLDRLADIKNRYDPESFIVLGDFKHNFGRSENQEFGELLDIMDYLLEDSSLVMIKGNHDNYLKNYTNMKGVPLYEEKMILDDMTLTHGHKKVNSEGLLIMGHEHPAIEIKDEVGSKLRFPCFLHNSKRRILVLPAIDPLSEGRDVIASTSFFSKNLEHLDQADFQIYAISETGLMDFHRVGDVRNAQPCF